MVTQTLNADEFFELLVGAIDNLTSHSYIANYNIAFVNPDWLRAVFT